MFKLKKQLLDGSFSAEESALILTDPKNKTEPQIFKCDRVISIHWSEQQQQQQQKTSTDNNSNDNNPASEQEQEQEECVIQFEYLRPHSSRSTTPSSSSPHLKYMDCSFVNIMLTLTGTESNQIITDFTRQISNLHSSSPLCLSSLMEADGLPTDHKVSILVNPVSGHRQGSKFVSQILEPFLQYFPKLTYKVFTSKAGGDIEAVAKELNFNATRLVIVVGGDGTLFECMNGINNNETAKASENVPLISVFPNGSGNSVANSLSQTPSVDFSLKALLNGRVVEVNPMLVTVPAHPEPKKVLSMCVVSCGFHAKLVRDSDSLRWLGPIRFSLLGLKQMFFRPKCLIKLKLTNPKKVIFDNNDVLDNRNVEKVSTMDTESDTIYEGLVDYFIASKVANLEEGFTIAPRAHVGQVGMNLFYIPGRLSTSELAGVFGDIGKGEEGANHIQNHSEKIRYVQTNGFELTFLLTDQHQQHQPHHHDFFICIDGEIYEVPLTTFTTAANADVDVTTDTTASGTITITSQTVSVSKSELIVRFYG